MKKKYLGIIVAMLLIIPIFPVTASNLQISVKSKPDESPKDPLLDGPVEAKLGENCTYTAVSTDPQNDLITYKIEFSDAPRFEYTKGPYQSGERIEIYHSWDDFYQNRNPFIVRVKAIDSDGHESEWARFSTQITDLNAKSKDTLNLNQNIAELFEMIFGTRISNNFDKDFSGNWFENGVLGNIFNKAN